MEGPVGERAVRAGTDGRGGPPVVPADRLDDGLAGRTWPGSSARRFTTTSRRGRCLTLPVSNVLPARKAARKGKPEGVRQGLLEGIEGMLELRLGALGLELLPSDFTASGTSRSSGPFGRASPSRCYRGRAAPAPARHHRGGAALTGDGKGVWKESRTVPSPSYPRRSSTTARMSSSVMIRYSSPSMVTSLPA